MTLIAFATYGNRAEIVTDTAAYSNWARNFGYRTKVTPKPHLNAAFAFSGQVSFSGLAKLIIDNLDISFDDTAQRAPEAFREAWEGLDDRDRQGWAAAFFIGLSATADEFVAYRYTSDHHFEPERIHETYVIPTPIEYRPRADELDDLFGGRPEYQQLRDEWATQPPPPAPASREEWIQLAIKARQRALHPDPTLKVFVAGQLVWTRLAPGRIRSEVIHEFNDTGKELDLLVAGTLHPRAQIAPCRCGSGQRALDCHIAAHADQDCPCDRYDKTFRDCCMLTPEEAVAAETMGLV